MKRQLRVEVLERRVLLSATGLETPVYELDLGKSAEVALPDPGGRAVWPTYDLSGLKAAASVGGVVEDGLYITHDAVAASYLKFSEGSFLRGFVDTFNVTAEVYAQDGELNTATMSGDGYQEAAQLTFEVSGVGVAELEWRSFCSVEHNYRYLAGAYSAGEDSANYANSSGRIKAVGEYHLSFTITVVNEKMDYQANFATDDQSSGHTAPGYASVSSVMDAAVWNGRNVASTEVTTQYWGGDPLAERDDYFANGLAMLYQFGYGASELDLDSRSVGYSGSAVNDLVKDYRYLTVVQLDTERAVWTTGEIGGGTWFHDQAGQMQYPNGTSIFSEPTPNIMCADPYMVFGTQRGPAAAHDAVLSHQRLMEQALFEGRFGTLLDEMPLN